jgi:hypothetical protein
MIDHGRAADYLDGSLTPDEEKAFLDHLADCSICDAALADEIQLRDHEESLSRPLRRRRRTLRLAIGSSTSVLASVAVALLIWPGGSDPISALQWHREKGFDPYRAPGDDPKETWQPGDRLVAVLQVRSAHAELRVYRGDGELVARCPGMAAIVPAVCRASEGRIELTQPLDRPGQYQLIGLESPAPLPGPTGDREDDLKAVRERRGRIAGREAIHVN